MDQNSKLDYLKKSIFENKPIKNNNKINSNQVSDSHQQTKKNIFNNFGYRSEFDPSMQILDRIEQFTKNNNYDNNWIHNNCIDFSDCYILYPRVLQNRPRFLMWITNLINSLKLRKSDQILSRSIILIDLTFKNLPKEKITTHKMNLIGITCIWIAIKYELTYFPLTYFIKLLPQDIFNQKKITDESIINYERKILFVTDFKLSLPTHIDILKDFIYQIFIKHQYKNSVFKGTSQKVSDKYKKPEKKKLKAFEMEDSNIPEDFCKFVEMYKLNIKQLQRESYNEFAMENQNIDKFNGLYFKLREMVYLYSCFYLKFLYQSNFCLNEIKLSIVSCIIISFEELKDKESEFFENVEILFEDKLEYFRLTENLDSIRTKKIKQKLSPMKKVSLSTLKIHSQLDSCIQENQIDSIEKFSSNCFMESSGLESNLFSKGSQSDIKIEQSSDHDNFTEEILEKWKNTEIEKKNVHIKNVCINFLNKQINNLISQFDHQILSQYYQEIIMTYFNLKNDHNTISFIDENKPHDSLFISK